MYGNSWRRAGAFLIDAVISLLFAFLAMRMVVSPLFPLGANATYLEYWNTLSPSTKVPWLLLIYAYPWLYYALFESSSRQATVGKMLLKLKVTDLQGNRITFWRATGRFWAKRFFWVFFLFTIISAALVAFTKTKQSLHDKIARTFVVNSGPNV